MSGRPSGSDSASEAGENDESRATWEQRGDNRSPATGQKVLRFAEMLKREFHLLADRLTRHVPAPAKQRKRTEETRGGFMTTATQIMRRREVVPEAACAAVTFLFDTLDWLNPWHHEVTGISDFDQDFQTPGPNHLFPHL